MALSLLPPTDTRFFFRPVAVELVDLLRTLPAPAWSSPTVAGPWVVRDVVAHLVDTGLRRLSFHRDRHEPPPPERPPRTEREFVAFINDLNRQWVDVSRRVSPRMLTDLYELVGLQLADFTESFPENGAALFPVSWAGDEQSEGWFDLGREFTEIWHHQAQIRDAVGAAPLRDPAWLHAMLLISIRGLPHAYRAVEATSGQSVTIEITGAAGGIWTLRHEGGRWTLWAGAEAGESARIVMSDDTAWRLLFNALSPEQARRLVAARGEAALLTPFLAARSVIV